MGKWLKKSPDWLKDYSEPKSKTSITTFNKSTIPQDNITTIIHIPIQCPKCESRRVRCTGTAARPVLYYKCQDCKFKFKVLEKKPET